MKNHERELASNLLSQAADRYGSDTCHDWNFPASWSVEQKQEFVKDFHDWNGDPEEYDPKFLQLPNFAVMAFLAHRLSQVG